MLLVYTNQLWNLIPEHVRLAPISTFLNLNYDPLFLITIRINNNFTFYVRFYSSLTYLLYVEFIYIIFEIYISNLHLFKITISLNASVQNSVDFTRSKINLLSLFILVNAPSNIILSFNLYILLPDKNGIYELNIHKSNNSSILLPIITFQTLSNIILSAFGCFNNLI